MKVSIHYKPTRCLSVAEDSTPIRALCRAWAGFIAEFVPTHECSEDTLLDFMIASRSWVESLPDGPPHLHKFERDSFTLIIDKSSTP